MAEACEAAGCALLGGETAEMPGVYAPDAFDIAGTLVGVAERAALLPRAEVGAGDVVVAVASSGPHTNGYSLLRRLFEWLPMDVVPAGMDRPLGEALLEPHRSYLDVLAAALASGGVKALAHITGGGLVENVPRVLPTGVDARIRRRVVARPAPVPTGPGGRHRSRRPRAPPHAEHGHRHGRRRGRRRRRHGASGDRRADVGDRRPGGRHAGRRADRAARLMGARRPVLAVAVTVIALLACTDDDDAQTEPTAPTTDATASESAVEPTDTEPTPTTEAVATTEAVTTTTLPPVVATRSLVAPLIDTNPNSVATTLLPAANARGPLLVGTTQQRPGERYTATLWESPDGINWNPPLDVPSFADGTSSGAYSATWIGTELVVGGDLDDDAGISRPAVWNAPDGVTFGPAVDPFDAPGSVNALVATAGGLLAAGATLTPEGLVAPMVAMRTASGWVPTALPVSGGEQATATAAAASGSTIVVVGWTDTGDLDQASVWVSSDGGATYAVADVSAVHSNRGSALRSVVATPQGFAALACTANASTTTTAILTSPDGVSWQHVEVAAVDDTGVPFPNVEDECSSLTAFGERLIIGAVDLGRGWILDVGLDGVGSARFAPRGPNRIAASAPLAVPLADGTIGVVAREHGGFSSGRAGDGGVPSGSGLPPGHPQTTGFGIVTLVDQLLGRAIRYPIVTELPNGYTWQGEPAWVTSADGVTWNAVDASMIPPGASLLRSGNGIDVAFGVADDPADSDLGGPQGATAAWVRAAGQPWTPVGNVTSGPGGDRIDDAIAVPGGFVAVGSASVRDPAGATTSSPIVLVSGDGLTWNPESVPVPSDRAGLSRVCPLPNGGVLAFGSAIIDGRTVLFAARRDPSTGAWTALEPGTFPPDVDTFFDCDVVGSVAVLVTTDVDDQPVAYTTTDGASFASVPVEVPDAARASINSLAAVGDRLFGAGTVSIGGDASDVALWQTADGTTWTLARVDGFAAPKGQTVSDLVVSPAGTLVIAGSDHDAPVSWVLPVPP